MIYRTIYESIAGRLFLEADDHALIRLSLYGDEPDSQENPDLIQSTIAYHSIRFQAKAWSFLQEIPYGTTVTCKETAAGFGGNMSAQADGIFRGIEKRKRLMLEGIDIYD